MVVPVQGRSRVPIPRPAQPGRPPARARARKLGLPPRRLTPRVRNSDKKWKVREREREKNGALQNSFVLGLGWGSMLLNLSFPAGSLSESL